MSTDSDLQFFHRASCPFTKKADEQVACLEAHLQRRVSRVETSSRAGSEQYQEAGGFLHCGGVPFFYNKVVYMPPGAALCLLSLSHARLPRPGHRKHRVRSERVRTTQEVGNFQREISFLSTIV